MTEPTNADTMSQYWLGQFNMTPEASCELDMRDVLTALKRHHNHDWGDVCPADRMANDTALRSGGRLLSVYHTVEGVKFWIITEADRSATTVLLPDEY